MKETFGESELIVNDDGSCFHLHLKPEHLADKVILVGAPGRANLVASYFDTIENEVENREFHSITGIYKGKRITCQSTGIGCDNIDIVMNEIDALANIDFKTRTIMPNHRTLTIVRIGTCGGLQPTTPIGTYIASVKSIGFDGLLNYYAGRDEVCDHEVEESFKKHMDWSPKKGAPYVSQSCPELIDRIAGEEMHRGITISCGGFYGPQGRQLRMKIQDPDQNAKVQSFCYETSDGSAIPGMNGLDKMQILNFEMESSALSGLSSLLGHKAMTCCMVLANRYKEEAITNYETTIKGLIRLVLDRI